MREEIEQEIEVPDKKSRKIEFRGISQIDGRWVYGSLIIKEFQNPNWEDLTKLQYVYNYEICCKDENDWASIYENIPVFEQTIGQYTGLKDKNGNKIFEGDIVIAHYFFQNYDPTTLGAFEDEDEITGKIVCDLDGFRVIDRIDECRQLPLSMIQEPVEDLEVIGNVYNNPELLKGE